jgi:hypothetical protein
MLPRVLAYSKILERLRKLDFVMSRKFTMEGSLHLFSSPPSVLTPADIYRVANDSAARSLLVGSNIYLIACRPRILIDSSEFCLEGDMFSGFLLVTRDGAWRKVPFHYRLSLEHHLGCPERCEIAVSVNGTSALVKNDHGQFPIAVHRIISNGECDLFDDERDLHVLYVGQGIGRSQQKLAIDRLSRHSTFQRILADFHTHHPEMELLVLLFRFEHSRKLISSGGDLTLTPEATEREDQEHLQKMQQSSFERKKRIALAEAALINYFKPYYNTIFKETNFAIGGKLKFLQTLISQDMVGLVVEVSTSNLRSRLRSESRAPTNLDQSALDLIHGFLDGAKRDEIDRSEFEQILRSHFIRIPLTSADERDSFLHGMRWQEDDSR